MGICYGMQLITQHFGGEVIPETIMNMAGQKLSYCPKSSPRSFQRSGKDHSKPGYRHQAMEIELGNIGPDGHSTGHSRKHRVGKITTFIWTDAFGNIAETQTIFYGAYQVSITGESFTHNPREGTQIGSQTFGATSILGYREHHWPNGGIGQETHNDD